MVLKHETCLKHGLQKPIRKDPSVDILNNKFQLGLRENNIYPSTKPQYIEIDTSVLILILKTTKQFEFYDIILVFIK